MAGNTIKLPGRVPEVKGSGPQPPSVTGSAVLKSTQLKPQVSVLLYCLSKALPTTEEILDAFETGGREVIERVYKRKVEKGSPGAGAAPGSGPVSRLTIGPIARDARSEWKLCGHWYAVGTTPQWIKRIESDDTVGGAVVLEDIRHHLTLLLVRSPNKAGNRFAVLLTSDPAARAAFDSQLERLHVPGVRQEELAQAFLRGASRQAWLCAVHRPTRVKPDSKGLAGLDLREALDPFGDQSFRLAAALSDPRSERNIGDFRASLPTNSSLRKLEAVDALGQPPKGAGGGLVGLSMRSGLIWTRLTDNIDDLLRELDALCSRIEDVRAVAAVAGAAYEQRGYEILARPQQGTSLESLGDACDFSFEFPMSLDPESEDASSVMTDAERRWFDGGVFDVLGNDEERLEVGARFRGREIATLRIQPLLHGDGRAELVITAERAQGVAKDDEGWMDLDYVLEKFDKNAAVWFRNGFTIQQGRVFSLKYRDVPFDRWVWFPFKDKARGLEYSVSTEKPAQSKLWDVDWTGRSLFEFVVNNVTSIFVPKGEWHLICDDGSGEIADFVFLEPNAKRLRLIHVKAAEESVNRGIAPAVYEVVVSQATKNLRFLDPSILAKRLRDQAGASRVDELTWETGGNRLTNRDKAIRALKGMGAYLDRGVVVLQPHTRRSTWRTAERELRQNTLGDRDKVQFLRLRTLLADLEDVCRRFDATFECWGENDIEKEEAEDAKDGVAFSRTKLRLPDNVGSIQRNAVHI